MSTPATTSNISGADQAHQQAVFALVEKLMCQLSAQPLGASLDALLSAYITTVMSTGAPEVVTWSTENLRQTADLIASGAFDLRQASGQPLH